jgi:acyl carrier protein
MGLDLVEVIMGVEEAFDIAIPDEAAAELNTVGRLYAFVLSRLYTDRPTQCISSLIFYQARRALIDLSGAGRRSIRPSTRMEDLLPAKSRQEHWQNLSRAMGMQLPELALPRWLGLLTAGLGLALLLTSLAAYLTHPFLIALLYSMISALIAWTMHEMAAPFAVWVPAECATVGGTVKAIQRLNFSTYGRSDRNWDPNEAWETLRSVIAEQLQVPLEAVTPDADLVRDLGAD